MNRVDRLLGIITFLQSKKHATAEQIAHKYGISERTVYRDLKALAEQNVPISFEPNKGYCLVDGYFLPPVSFTADEANALVLMEHFISSVGDKSIANQYASVLNKVKAVLHSKQREKLQALTQHIQFQIHEKLQSNFDHFLPLQESITEKKIVHIQYVNNKNEKSDRSVEPIGLIFYAFAWHLIAWCHLRNEYRDFKIQRIVQVIPTHQNFEKKEHIAIADYMKQLPVSY